MQGKFSSNYLTWLEVRTSKCGSLYNNSVPCANQSAFDAIFAFRGEVILDFYYVNPLINAGNTEYLDYKMVDNNYVSITPTLGTHNNVLVEEYTI